MLADDLIRVARPRSTRALKSAVSRPSEASSVTVWTVFFRFRVKIRAVISEISGFSVLSFPASTNTIFIAAADKNSRHITGGGATAVSSNH